MLWGCRKPKVFCIGLNKTGTTSMAEALGRLGYRMGNQFEAERLIFDWAKRDFRRIVRYCRTADAFQDVPFSADYTYAVLDHAYPNSKFVLTVRENAEIWFESLVRFYTKLAKTEKPPTAKELAEVPYHVNLWEVHRRLMGIDESRFFNREYYLAYYDRHNAHVRGYFGYRPDDLLELNVADPDAMQKLCAFLRIPDPGFPMPHLNRSLE